MQELLKEKPTSLIDLFVNFDMKLAEYLNQSEGEITDEISQFIDEQTATMESKVDGICYLLDKLETIEQNEKAELERTKKKIQALQNRQKHIKEFFLKLVEARGEPLKGARFFISKQMNNPSFVESEALNEDRMSALESNGDPYIVKKIEYRLNKEQLIKDIKAGLVATHNDYGRLVRTSRFTSGNIYNLKEKK